MENKTNQAPLKRFSIIGAVILTIIIILLIATSYTLYSLRTELNEKQAAMETLAREAEERERKVAELEGKIKNLVDTQAEVLRSTANILESKKIQNIRQDVDWNSTLNDIVNMEPGKRKVAVVTSILLAIKQLKFRLGGRNPRQGFDSPGFIQYVFSFVEMDMPSQPGKMLSVSMMETCSEVSEPKAGDLMFFEGRPGNFVLLYLSPGKEGSPGVGAGHLGTNLSTGIYDTFQFKGKFKGYYRPPYPDGK
jgi:cell wall-associated NlpC family hydrolase